MIYFHLILIFTIIAKYADAANILIVTPFSSKSHYIMLSPIGLELAKRGHNVTIITSIKQLNPPPNYHQVMVENKEIWDVMGTKRPVIFDMTRKSFEEFLNEVLWNGGLGFAEMALKSTHLQEFLRKNNTFDLVISEQFYQESLNILAYKYKAPLVLIATTGICMKHNLVVGNPLQLNTIIFEALDLKDHTSIWGRLRNIYITAYEYVWWKYWYLGKQEALMKKYIPDLEEPVPSLFGVQKNTSLLLINTHFSFDPPMALLPNIVEIGGLHLSRSNSSLPKDLQDILDTSKNGVVYMNFGSNVVVSEMDQQKLMAFFNVFRKLKQTVLMKWEKDTVENKPDNVVIQKWFPQREIFEHPNIKVFISHGGLIGTQEATFNGIPILGVPIYADQYNNLELAEKHGFGKILEYQDISEVTLGESLNEILNDESYKRNAEEVAKRFKDRPMTPLETTIWWLEYVIRHEGATFMKSEARNMSWFKYFMLDIYVVVITTMVVVTYLMVFAVKNITRLLGFNFKTNSKKKRS
ncbi:UDP-glycosyltransferase UGT5-like isoform X2 [Epargyreus clarus]|uniref:UDP-glycosyltransferase UGT5-like isoform X2 n=1 Tax=Epargyreus clarus TaxID=520877 RepID=UPI003C2BC80A